MVGAGWTPIRWGTTRRAPTARSLPDCDPGIDRCSSRTEQTASLSLRLCLQLSHSTATGSVVAPPAQAGEHLFGLSDDLADQAGGRHEGLDGTDPLAGGRGLALGS